MSLQTQPPIHCKGSNSNKCVDDILFSWLSGFQLNMSGGFISVIPILVLAPIPIAVYNWLF